jgi:hypothetical protein
VEPGNVTENLTPRLLGATAKPILIQSLRATPAPIPIRSKNSTASKTRQGQGCPPIPPTPVPAPGDATNLRNGTFLFEPNEGGYLLRNYSGLYAGLTEIQKVYLRRLEIRDLIIDAAHLSERLRDCPNLETIILERVAISGTFSRVFLPSLKEFTFNQHRSAPTDDYKKVDVLKSLLFFDLKEGAGKGWDLEKDVLNLGVKIKVSVGGTTILEVNREEGRVNLNVKVCEEIYRNSNGSLTSMSLSWCPVKDPTLLPLNTLKYLNLNNAVPEKPILSQLLRGSTELEEFHAFLPFTCDNASYISAEYPEIMIFINLTDLSDKVHTVSLSKLAVYTLPEAYVSPIQNLALETVNITGILDNFHVNFPNLTKVAVFNSSSVEDGYDILGEILKTKAEWILMQDFNRSAEFTEIESFLTKVGIPGAERNFLLEREPLAGNYTGRSVSAFEKQLNRYKLLAFNDIDTYDDYSVFDAVYQ